MAHSKFHCQVLTPEGEVFNDEVEMVSTRTTTGSIGVLAHHTPLLAMLDPTELRLYKSESDVISFARGAPPLLAIQGTADTMNEPRFTYAFFGAARHPKYLLRLLGAGHLPPYTREQPQLGVVERVSTAFLDGYLKRRPDELGLLPSLGSVPRTAALVSAP